jgi:aminopeptidase N
VKKGAPQPVHLGDYATFPFHLHAVELRVELGREATRVDARLDVERCAGEAADTELVLDGEDLELELIAVDGKTLAPGRYAAAEDSLRIFDLPARCEVQTRVTLHPDANQRDEGLMVLGDNLATQCEAEGFRRITFFPDRPDVLSVYTVTLVGDPEIYPVMLSNGHPVARGILADGRHWVRWEDPFPKPSYIFALVAGDFACFDDRYTTGSGREIRLAIYADRDRIDECGFAMGALKRALRWEEEKYGREFDLDLYNIVALTGHVGAMENKGLNIFDANGICADPEISTDDDYLVIERILAHEVFHNWTGNRVTCRDWFQLSLKEGLTRFRDQCFSQDMSAAGVKRIEFVRALQRNQFPEDDGPAAHPVKPEQYIEIRNFYTGTVYDKGAEVIRMLNCLLGDEAFRAAVRLYLSRHDLQAVTTEDFIRAVEDCSGRDLSQFYRWYRQAGRPRVSATGYYDAAVRRFELTLSQHHAPTPGQVEKQALHIPVLAGLLGADGREIEGVCDEATRVDGVYLLELRKPTQCFSFEGVDEEPVPSLLRGFSAPVTLEANLDAEQLAILLAHDPDPYNRWQSGQTLATDAIRAMAGDWHARRAMQVDGVLVAAWERVLRDRDSDQALVAELLLLPDEPALSEGLPQIDLDGHMAARDHLLAILARRNRELLLSRYHELAQSGPYQFTPDAIGRRRLRNRCLEILLALPDEEVRDLALAQVQSAENMTEMFAALAALCHVDCPQRQLALQGFYDRWQHKPPVIDKWFNAQALSRMEGAIDAILALEQHPAMDIMNMPRAMAFYGGFFRQNRVAFNAPDGRGYDMLAERLILVDSIKPGTTYWLMPQILQWRRFDLKRQALMKQALEKVMAADISRGLYEIVSKALAEDQ